MGVFTHPATRLHSSDAERNHAITRGAPFGNLAHVRVPDVQGVAHRTFVLGEIIALLLPDL